MSALTFNEWRERGFFVLKGEKSSERNKKGVATFTRKQVTSGDTSISGVGRQSQSHSIGQLNPDNIDARGAAYYSRLSKAEYGEDYFEDFRPF